MESFLIEKANGRSWYLKTMINGKGSIQKIYNEETVYHDFYTTTQKRKYVSSKDNIVIDLTPTKDEYKVLVFTRQNDKEKTMKLIKDVWPGEVFNPWDCDNSRHVHRTIPLCESNENVAKIMEQVLSDIKAYRDKEYPSVHDLSHRDDHGGGGPVVHFVRGLPQLHRSYDVRYLAR